MVILEDTPVADPVPDDLGRDIPDAGAYEPEETLEALTVSLAVRVQAVIDVPMMGQIMDRKAMADAVREAMQMQPELFRVVRCEILGVSHEELGTIIEPGIDDEAG